jgi:hypothetical protein
VLKLGGLFKPRSLVLQIEVRGAANTETPVYAEVFYTRSRAEKAAKAADDRMRVRIGDVSIGKRRWAQLLKLPRMPTKIISGWKRRQRRM